jgi:hypothetical protein
VATKDITDVAVCEAYRDARRLREEGGVVFPGELLQMRTGECTKVCVAAMQRAVGRGLVECGVALAGGRLTAAGEELLRNPHLDATASFPAPKEGLTSS